MRLICGERLDSTCVLCSTRSDILPSGAIYVQKYLDSASVLCFARPEALPGDATYLWGVSGLRFAVRFKCERGFAQNPLSSFLSGCVGSLMCPFPALVSANPRALKKSFWEVGCKILSQPPSQPLSQPPYTTPGPSATDFEKMLWLPDADGQLHEGAVASIGAGGRIGACSNNPV